ncbi:tail sheath protein [Exiguobacterium phage vB_EalM-132]|nr:tail sheath protein [Exiguobacterium phage vB_EalM-132]
MANQRGFVFGGKQVVHPGAYHTLDANGTTQVTPGSSNVPILVGQADAGKSGEVMWFSNIEDARAILRGGELLTALELVFSPSPEGGGGASVAGVVVANATTQASVTSGGIKATSLEYGAGGNRIQFKIENGTIASTKKVTVHRWDTEDMQVYDNLGAVLQVQYTGNMAYSTLTVTVTNNVATKIETKLGTTSADAVVDLSIDLTEERYATIEDVARHINSMSGYSVTYVSYAQNSNLPVSTLDAVADLNIKTPKYITSVKGDVAFQINNLSSLINVEVTGAISNQPFKYLVGGARGVAPASWATYFDVIKKQFSDVLVVLDSSEAIHAEATLHVQQMEGRQQPQILLTGGAIGESVQKTKQRAATLNSSRVVLAYPGIYHKSVGAGKVALPRYMTAALIAGRICGVDASEPITFDYFNLVGLEVDLLAGDPIIDELIVGGVATLERVASGAVRLVQGITTYMGPTNPIFSEISVRRGADKLATTMRRTMEDTFTGRKGLRATISAVQTKAIDILEQAIRDGDIVAYGNINVRFVGGAIYVDYEVAPVEPINFILITSHFVPEGTIVTGQE